MAATPLFVSSTAVLRKRLRLTGVANDDPVEIIDEAIRKARVKFYDSLGASRVTTIKAIPSSDTPTTDDGILRMKADNTEVLIVKFHLLCDLPVLFMDSSGELDEKWNSEGVDRHLDFDEINALKTRLSAQIEAALEDLASGDADAGTVNATTFCPDVTPPRPGASIKPAVFTLDGDT